MRQLLVLLIFLFPLTFLSGQVTINVPGDYSTIQAAINAANNGDLVLVADGIYQENIIFRGKAITVASHFIINTGDTSHITHTIIDGSNPIYPDSASVVSFKSGEDTTSVICGFTIRGGTGTIAPNIRAGGGILVYNSGAIIKNNIIEYNTLDNIPKAYGGGIFTSGNSTNILIQNNIIRNNTCNGTEHALGGGIEIFTEMGYVLISNNKILDNIISGGGTTGGGIDIWGPITEVQVISNLIKGNMSQSNSGGGGGIDIYECVTVTPILKNNIIVGNYSNAYAGGVYVDLPTENSFKSGMIKSHNTSKSDDVIAEQFFINNTIYNNTATLDGGGICTFDMTSTIINCILWGNTAQFSPQIAGTVNVEYSDVEGGWSGTGNINEHPLFDMGSEFYHLWETSPCVDSGNPGPQYNDIEDPNHLGYAMEPAWGTLRNDIGHAGGPSSLWCYWEWPIPVELTSFTATLQSGIVNLQWTTATETNNLGFEVERKLENSQWERIGFAEGHGTTTEQQDYSFVDVISSIHQSIISYRLKQLDFNGGYEYSDEVFVDNLAPINYSLEQNYPNPFNPSTTISYSLPATSHVELVVYNSLGESVKQLVNELKEAGHYSVELNAESLPSGVYFYRLQAGDFVQVNKMMLIK